LTIDDLLDAARARLDRVDAADAPDALQRGATLIDIRSDSQIAEDGTVPGALLIARMYSNGGSIPPAATATARRQI
jgi:hypothetical protein